MIGSDGCLESLQTSNPRRIPQCRRFLQSTAGSTILSLAGRCCVPPWAIAPLRSHPAPPGADFHSFNRRRLRASALAMAPSFARGAGSGGFGGGAAGQQHAAVAKHLRQSHRQQRWEPRLHSAVETPLPCARRYKHRCDHLRMMLPLSTALPALPCIPAVRSSGSCDARLQTAAWRKPSVLRRSAALCRCSIR